MSAAMPIPLRCPHVWCGRAPTVSWPSECVVTCGPCVDIDFPHGHGRTEAKAIEEWNAAIIIWLCEHTTFDAYVPEGLGMEALS